MTLTTGLDLAAVFVFALTGALTASRAQLDVVGFIFIAALTAVGGGTLRDLFLGRLPVFWVKDPTYIGVISVAALLVFFTAHLLESRYKAILWLDAAALAVAVPAGVFVALSLDHGFAVILMMGVVTGCFGGLMRDVVCNEVPLVLQKGELYVTTAFAGGLAAVLCLWLGLPVVFVLLACGSMTFLLRAGSIIFGWSLPVYRPRPKKDGPSN
ncbi:trimeric intracellular cation channel family protein [Actibacterium pelagium]|uniref:Membrane protein n=1 Tax=Actibacterium pelagium TaxID=2029103 RepID=A0A917AFG0_9RHOB|nr:trimeric intracellular cation channel family protein [Actibacterium pelagium]GGE49195.1 membrane protein [Actibacterium pelagium]